MTSFKEAYGRLSGHAQTLRNQQEPNIDDLLSIVTESVDAYKVCKQRIDAVEAALEKALSDPEVAASAAPHPQTVTRRPPTIAHPGPPRGATLPTTDVDNLDDIPF